MPRLIVHADDFGLTEKVNAGISKAFREGILSSTSIMAVGGGYENAVEIARTEEKLDVGVHLTLVEEMPLLHKSAIGSLVTAEGRFPSNVFHFFRRYCCGQILLDEVYRELDAQILRVLNAGIKVSHLDSHQHVHMLPGVLKVTGMLAKKHNIKAIRFPREKILPEMWSSPALFGRILQAKALGWFCLFGRKERTVAPADFYGFVKSGCLEKADVTRIIENLSVDTTAELMCHPGMDEPGSLYRHWNYQWQEELDLLLDLDLLFLLKKNNVDLISYRDVVGE